MTVDILSARITKDKCIILECTDSSEENLMRLERTRDDGFERNLTFVFDTTDAKTCKYFYDWIHRQKRVKMLHPSTYGEALQALPGTRVVISGKYIEPD